MMKRVSEVPRLTSPHYSPISSGTNDAGAFGAFPGYDAHILSTLSAIQILVMHDALERLNIPRVVSCTSRYLEYGGRNDRYLTSPSHSLAADSVGDVRGRPVWRDGHPILILLCVGVVVGGRVEAA